jgi:lipopolysaccharide/colanic/teichoic acid biosynthesis glycosyltransferase
VSGAAAKRVTDVVGATLLAFALLPLMLMLAAGLAISLGGVWPFFVQERVGRGGRRFRMVKLRTLPVSTPRYATKYTLDTTSLPWLARTLRRRHLDELPQLFLVITGRMSLVGPRPEQPDQAADLAVGFNIRRTSVRPGCTGLWQISHRSVGLIGESPVYDDTYVADASLRLDLWILVRTLRLFVAASSMIDLVDVPAWARGRRTVDVRPAVDLASA